MREIRVCRNEFDDGIEFEALLDGQLVGYYDCWAEAQQALDAIMYERARRGQL
ncbi:MAG: hypothetical protein HC927_06640 [Deltaproteobacteria bacterium]|nr:hypothetical protein [Deltaproteobacteria bacterium]